MSAKQDFVNAMIPILEQESGMTWGPKSVGKIVRWTCKQSGTIIKDDTDASAIEPEDIVARMTWNDT